MTKAVQQVPGVRLTTAHSTGSLLEASSGTHAVRTRSGPNHHCSGRQDSCSHFQ
jgi:hypothetical protein